MRTIDANRVRERIRRICTEYENLSATDANDVAFHMTDWVDDLQDFYRLAAEPDGFTDDEARELMIRFLLHVPNHVAAAAKLFTGIPVTDVFGVGATVEENEDTP